MKTNKLRWIIPLVMNIMLLLPFLKFTEHFDKALGYSLYPLQIIICFYCIFTDKTDYIFWALSVIISYFLLCILIMSNMTNHLGRGFLGEYADALVVEILNLIIQTVTTVFARIFKTKNRNKEKR
ncbi:MAG: hypothetical protein J5956_05675 [Ruminococcus sp.]|nr:hypothetical protein [Ruminococcus sp.]